MMEDSAEVLTRYATRFALTNASELAPPVAKAKADPAEAERQARIARAWMADPGPGRH